MKRTLQILVVCLGLSLSLANSKAAVNFVFTPSSTNVALGGTFNVTLSLQVTAGEAVSGVDYLFQQLTSAGFYISGRNGAGSIFDSVVTPNATILSRPNANLDPTNNNDLGAFTSDQSTRGSGLLETYSISLDPSVTVGTYTISTTSGFYSGAGPNFPSNPISQNGTLTITVVPEPTTWAFLVLGGLGALATTRFRARRRG